MSTMTFCLTRLWKAYIRITEKFWGFSFQSNQANSPVCAADCHLTKSSKRCYHRDFEMVWQGLQTLGMYHTSFPVSILSSTSAQTHWITRRSTQKQQVGNGSVGKLWKLYRVIPSSPPIFLDAYVFFFPFLPGRSWKGPVIHPEDSQSFSYDCCRCGLQPRAAHTGEGGFQAG